MMSARPLRKARRFVVGKSLAEPGAKSPQPIFWGEKRPASAETVPVMPVETTGFGSTASIVRLKANAICVNASASQRETTAICVNASASQRETTAICVNASASQRETTAICVNASASQRETTAICVNAFRWKRQATAFGPTASDRASRNIGASVCLRSGRVRCAITPKALKRSAQGWQATARLPWVSGGRIYREAVGSRVCHRAFNLTSGVGACHGFPGPLVPRGNPGLVAVTPSAYRASSPVRAPAHWKQF
jgi:hypothetical protein